MNTKNIIKSITLFVLGIIALMMPFTICLADAGYSSSYSGGGYSGGGSSYSGGSYSSGGSFSSSSWDSGSGIDYDRSGYGSSTSSGEFGASFIFFVSIVAFFIMMILVLNSNSIGNKYYNSPNQNFYQENNDVKKINFLTQEEVDKIDSSINTQEIMKYVFDLFVKEQKAWMNFDYDGLRELLSDELFNSYKMQLETAELNNEKNIVENIAMLYDSGIYSLEKNDYTEQLMVQLHVKMIDYIIDVKTGDIKFGNNMHRLENTYIITLEKSIRSEIKNCPECGAKITSKASQKCKHCDAILVKGSKEFVIVKQENINKE